MNHFATRWWLACTLLLVSSPAAAETVTRFDWVPGTSQYGDVWTFKCPAGGTVDVTVQNRNDGGGGSDLDFLMAVRDGTGAFVGGGDDDVTCIEPGCFGCPQDLDIPCGAGGEFAIIVQGVSCSSTSGIGGGYGLAVEVSDSNGVSLPAKKVKLGGGPKVKAPAWLPAASNPLIDDGKVN